MASPEFAVSERRPEEVAGACDFAVVERDSGHVVIHNRSNGQGVYLTYHTLRGAAVGMARAGPGLNTTIWERQESRRRKS